MTPKKPANKKLAAMTANRDRLEHELNLAIAQRDEAREERDEAYGERSMIKQERDEAREARDHAKANYEKTKKWLDTARSENADYAGEISSANAIADNAIEEADKFGQELIAAKEALVDVRTSEATITKERDQALTRNKNLVSECQQLTAQAGFDSDTIKLNEGKIVLLRNTIAANEDEISRIANNYRVALELIHALTEDNG